MVDGLVYKQHQGNELPILRLEMKDRQQFNLTVMKEVLTRVSQAKTFSVTIVFCRSLQQRYFTTVNSYKKFCTECNSSFSLFRIDVCSHTPLLSRFLGMDSVTANSPTVIFIEGIDMRELDPSAEAGESERKVESETKKRKFSTSVGVEKKKSKVYGSIS